MVRSAFPSKPIEPSDVDPPHIELRIPGPWPTFNDFAADFAAAGTEFILQEDLLVKKGSDWSCQFGPSPHDDQIADLFAADGRLSESELADIASHACKVHLTGGGGSVANAEAMMEAATAVLRSGGFGVMIDNSGVTHGRDDWFKLASDMNGGGHYWAYVGTGRDKSRTLFSTGMHCLGFRDAELFNPPDDDQHAYFILHNFLGYSYRSGAVIEDGHIMGDEVAGVAMQVKAAPCTRVPNKDSPFYNPYGIWRLEPIQPGDEIIGDPNN